MLEVQKTKLEEQRIVVEAYEIILRERLSLEAKIKEAESKLETAQPKIAFYDAVTDSTDAIDLGTAAKVLNLGIGRNKLFEALREKKVLMHNNQPYQMYIDRGYFRTIEQKYVTPDGTTHINIKTVVYQKGLNAIRTMLDEEE